MTRVGRCGSHGDLPQFEQLEAERLDLREDAEQRGPIFEQAGEHGLAALQLGAPSRERPTGR